MPGWLATAFTCCEIFRVRGKWQWEPTPCSKAFFSCMENESWLLIYFPPFPEFKDMFDTWGRSTALNMLLWEKYLERLWSRSCLGSGELPSPHSLLPTPDFRARQQIHSARVTTAGKEQGLSLTGMTGWQPSAQNYEFTHGLSLAFGELVFPKRGCIWTKFKQLTKLGPFFFLRQQIPSCWENQITIQS